MTMTINWQHTPPDVWPTKVAFYPERCAICERNVQGSIITNVRGVWEHHACVAALWENEHIDRQWTICTQRDVIVALKKHTHIEAVCNLERPDTGRYAWRKML